MPPALATVLAYHERSKHHPHRYAPSLGYLDWDTQPDPFRRFQGTELLELDEIPPGGGPRYDDLFLPDTIPAQPLNQAGISQLFYDSLALSAWKEFEGHRWSLRCNPSSGNLHPTEGYLISGPIPGLADAPALYHYQPYLHALEHRAGLSADFWQEIAAQLPANAVLVGLSSILWRESWKYGERAFRYCQHDVGHAVAAVALAAAALGWETRMLAGIPDQWLGRLLGIDGQSGFEAEHPDCLLALYPAAQSFSAAQFIPPAVPDLDLRGRPNRLSPDHQPWPIIDEVAKATRLVDDIQLAGRKQVGGMKNVSPPPTRPISARQIIRQRRSAVAMDRRTHIGRETFYRMLMHTLPGEHAPLSTLSWQPYVDLALFVHRVDGLIPGLYLLVRNPDHLAALRADLREKFLWQRPPGCPDGLDLYLLAEQDLREIAAGISCGQDTAGDGAFAVGMLAEFEPALRMCGPSFYKRLFWETGVIGQILYLEAEAAGIRGTGIGCFFDDSMHQMLGIEDRRFQSLYHFTVGGPVEDARLQTHAAYDHLHRTG